MILLWGLSGDDPLEEVRQALQRRGAAFQFLDQRDAPATEIEFEFGRALTGVVRTPRQVVELGGVTAAYVRAYDSRKLPEVARAGEGSPVWSHALAVESALYSWVESTDALVVNKPSAMASNNSKPYQAAIIERHGFAVPATLITTDPVAVKQFWDAHGEVIYKSISSVRSIVSRLTPDHLERLPDVAWCPTQFQQHVPGRDYRVHVVGEELFPCEVVSEADDYRYASRQGAGIELRPCELPPDIGRRARTMAAAMGLPLAGVDLRRTPDGDWYCFEVNPSPGFTFYEPEGEHPIADAVARVLVQGRP